MAKGKNFRNYSEAVEDSIVNEYNNGVNAQGRLTNLISHISLRVCAFFSCEQFTRSHQDWRELCICRSSREDMNKKKISITINNRGKKMIKKDNKFLGRTAELLNNLVVVVFSPDDLRIIKDSQRSAEIS